jgi:hypothetical protein
VHVDEPEGEVEVGLGAPVLEPALGLAQPPTPALGGRELRWQLIAAPLAVTLVLGAIDGVGLGQDLRRDLLVAARRVAGRVGVHLRPVDRDHPDPDLPGLRAQRQHLPEQLRQRALMADPEARDRGVIGHRLAAITRNATSCSQRRSIRRDERSPIAHAYSNNATIIAGSCAARPHPSRR